MIVQAGPNSQFGGLSAGFCKASYLGPIWVMNSPMIATASTAAIATMTGFLTSASYADSLTLRRSDAEQMRQILEEYFCVRHVVRFHKTLIHIGFPG